MNLFLTILIALTTRSIIDCQYVDQTSMENKLFERYNRKVRPVKTNKDKLDISFAVHIRHIESVDEIQQVLKFHGTIFLSWSDSYLNWKPSDYNNTQNINVNAWRIWQPDIALFNSAVGTEYIFNYWKYPAWLTSFGTVAEWQDFTFSVTCKFDFYYFPNDRQTCTATLGSWMYDYSEIDWRWIDMLNVKTKLSWYGDEEKRHSNGWELINATHGKAFWGPAGVLDTIPPDVSPKFYWPMMLIKIELQRHRPYFYVTEVLPLILIGLLTLASFWIETETATLSILLVNLLSQGVLSWGLLHQLPPASGPLPRIVVIYGLNFGLTCFALFFHIVYHCVGKWKLDLPEYVGNLTDSADKFKPLRVKGISFYHHARFDSGDDQENIVDEDNEVNGEQHIQEPTSTKVLKGNRFPKLLDLIRRILFIIYFFIYFGLVITILV